MLWTHEVQLSEFTTILNVKEVLISARDQNHDTKKEQALSITSSQYDWFIFQNEHSWLAIALRDKLTWAWHKQHCLDSNQQRQINQSDCEITSNCGKKLFCVQPWAPLFLLQKKETTYPQKILYRPRIWTKHIIMKNPWWITLLMDDDLHKNVRNTTKFKAVPIL